MPADGGEEQCRPPAASYAASDFRHFERRINLRFHPDQFARLAARANRQYEAAQSALKAGDLGEFAAQIEALGETLEQLSAAR